MQGKGILTACGRALRSCGSLRSRRARRQVGSGRAQILAIGDPLVGPEDLDHGAAL